MGRCRTGPERRHEMRARVGQHSSAKVHIAKVHIAKVHMDHVHMYAGRVHIHIQGKSTCIVWSQSVSFPMDIFEKLPRLFSLPLSSTQSYTFYKLGYKLKRFQRINLTPCDLAKYGIAMFHVVLNHAYTCLFSPANHLPK